MTFDPAIRAVLFGEDRQALLPRAAIVEFCAITPGMVVADCGAGNGYLLEQLSEAVGPGGHVYASDLQAAMLDDAVVLVAELGLTNVSCDLATDEHTVPVADGSCDRAVLCQVWHDLADRARYLKDLKRILKVGGELVILNWEPIETGIGPKTERRWALGATRKVLEENGWEIVRTTSLTWANYGIAARAVSS